MKTVFFDVDTQIDFVYPAGALYVPGAEKLVPAFAVLNRYAAAHGIPVFSDMDAHAEGDPEFKTWPPHCISGTLGQRKPGETLLEQRVVVPFQPSEVRVESARQIVMEKTTLDVFDNPNLEGLLRHFAAERYVVYGVVTEYCVRCAALGLLRLGGRVELVTDAIQSLNPEHSRQMLEELTAGGGVLTTVQQVTA